MDAKTLKALKGSIRKWQMIVDGTGRDLGTGNCSLCALFCEEQDCDGCPVRQTSGLPFCSGTPYFAWVEGHHEAGRPASRSKIHDDETAIAAVLELEFLKSLLPGRK